MLDGVKKKTITDRVQLPRLYLAWHSPALLKPADATMDILSNVLAGGKNSRLYRRLVYELQIAQDVDATSSRSRSAAIPDHGYRQAGTDVEKILPVIDEELDKLRVTAPEAAGSGTRAESIEAEFFRGMERVSGT